MVVIHCFHGYFRDNARSLGLFTLFVCTHALLKIIENVNRFELRSMAHVAAHLFLRSTVFVSRWLQRINCCISLFIPMVQKLREQLSVTNGIVCVALFYSEKKMCRAR